MNFEFRQAVIESDGYFARKEAIEDEESKVVAECAFCGADINEDDVDCIVHSRNGLGICASCLDESHWT